MKATVLCYNLKGTPKGKKIAMIFGALGFKIQHVEPEDYLEPVGVLAGVKKVDPDAPKMKILGSIEMERFPEEMLIMNPTTQASLDKALLMMRKEKARVDLKAVLTTTNQDWTSVALYNEIRQEHYQMKLKNDEHIIDIQDVASIEKKKPMA